MKKRLLFMLTMVMLMCALVFGANAANDDCAKYGHIYKKDQVVKATCTEQGYDVYKCTRVGCDSFYQENYVKALGHDMVDKYVNMGTYYLNKQTCKRENCSVKDEVEKENGSEVHYYSVEFINGQALDTRVADVKYTVLAETTKNEGLQTSIVRQDGSVTYVGKKPVRTKDVDYGEFRFIGWTSEDLDLVSEETVYGTSEDYRITVSGVNANVQYFAAWEGVDVTYSIIVYNSDGTQLLVPQQVKHGGCIDYPFSYPTRESETSVDFNEFKGWEIGTKTATGDQYNFYSVKDIHIKNVPIYSGDAIKAVHGTTPRTYNIEFCDANWNSQKVIGIPYGDDATKRMSGINYGNYSDDTYVYEYKGYWETEKGQIIYLNSLAVPKGSVDFDDSIYLIDEDGNYFKTVDGEKNLEIEQLHDYYEKEPGYFNKNVLTYLFPVTEDGEYFINSRGNALCLVVDSRGINEIDVNGNRVAFTAEDAKNLRNIKIRPVYRQKVKDYDFTIEVNLPTDELVPDDYKNGLIVQVTNENGQLLASGLTKDWECKLSVTKAQMYNITVVSSNGKYFAEKGIVWDVFKAMYDKGDNVKMDLEKDPKYTEEYQSRCICLCHNSFFRGIWVRVLNVMYSLFKVKYVCCNDMYITLRDLLAYTK